MQLEQGIVAGVAIVTVMGDITLNREGNVLLKDKAAESSAPRAQESAS